MREIKFRAWTGPWASGKYRMIYSGDLSEKGNADNFTFDNGILMQYTGLKDKNGTEIYEGDIVIAWSAGVKAICEVKWGQGRAGFFLYRKPNIAWNLSGGGKDYNEENVEVIGNIYEHPHLLGGEEE